MKVKNIKCAVMLLVVLLSCVIPLSALAAETELTTTVPSEFFLSIEIEGKGTVSVNGTEYTESTQIIIKRHEQTDFLLTANDGYEIKSVLWNGEEKENTFSIENIEMDSVLKVIFSPKSSDMPQTGDNSLPIWWYISIMVVAMIGMIFCIRKTQKR